MSRIVALDYGHGGVMAGEYQTAGKRYRFQDGHEVLEGVLNREIAARMVPKLLALGLRVWDVVSGRELGAADTDPSALDPRDIPLAVRVSNANEALVSPSIYVSVHCNAIAPSSSGPSQGARGSNVFHYPSVASTEVARVVGGALRDAQAVTGIHYRGDRQASFYVLRHTRMPAILVECGFFDNREEAERLATPAVQEAIASALVSGIDRAIAR